MVRMVTRLPSSQAPVFDLTDVSIVQSAIVQIERAEWSLTAMMKIDKAALLQRAGHTKDTMR